MLLLLALLLAPTLSQDPVRGSDAWYGRELETLRVRIEDPALGGEAHWYSELPWYLSNPERAEARPALSLERRIEHYRELIALARAAPALNGHVFDLVRYLAVVEREAGGIAGEEAHWLREAERLAGPFAQSYAWIAAAQLARARSAWTATLEALDRAQAVLAAEESGAEDLPLAGSLEDNLLWALHLRASTLVRCGLLKDASTLGDELWERANERIESLAAENGGELPDGPPEPFLNWVAAAELRLTLLNAQRRFRLLAPTFEEIQGARAYVEWLGLEPQAELEARLRLRVGIGEVEGLRQGDLADADPFESLVRAAEGIPREPFSEDAFRVRWWLARAYLDEGAHEEARAELAELRTLLDASTDDALEPYGLLLAALEAGVLRTAAERDGIAPALARLEAAFEAFLDHWANAPVDETGIGFLTFEEWNLIGSELIRLHALAQPGEAGVRAGFERVVRAQTLGTLARRLDARAPSLDEARALLLPGEGMLVFWYGRDAVHVFALDDEELAHFVLGADFELEVARDGLMRTLGRVLERSSPTPVAQLDGPLERAVAFFLPAPVRERIARWSGVALVGLESVGFVPFDLLPFEGDRELGRAKTVRYLPSLPVARALDERRSRHGNGSTELDLFLFSATRCGVPEELRAAYELDAGDLARLTGEYGERARIVEGTAATRQALLGTDLGSTTVAHLFVHGERDPRLRRDAGFRVWEAGAPAILAAAEIERRAELPELVLLTSCEAGRAPPRRGDDGAAHLGAAFLLGGASTLLMSYTDVGLRPSVELAAAFHTELRERGATPAEALRRARESLSSADRLARLHHGLVHVVGLGDRPLFAPIPDEPAGAGALARASAWAGAGLALVSLVLFSVSLTRRSRRSAGTTERDPRPGTS